MTCITLDAPLPLFAHAQAAARARLLASPLGALLPGERVADLFCGAGGWGEGAREAGITVDFAVDHWDIAIDTHRKNNPGCRHHQGDAWRTRPRDVVGNARIGLLLASAACTTHSRARGSAPISKRVHMLGWCIARWMEEVAPRIVLIENVPEWKDWGPTLTRPDGLRVQDPERKGQHFRRWWRYCERLGYAMEMRVLDAPDYGEASRRRRLFIIARRDGQPICWPEVTHGRKTTTKPEEPESGRQRAGAEGGRDHRVEVRGWSVHPVGGRIESGAGAEGAGFGSRIQNGTTRSEELTPYRTAAACIDWSDLGTSIFDRKRPLRPKTLARIAEGIRRFVLNDPAPFVLGVTQTGGGWAVSAIDSPLPTQTTRQDVAVATPVVQVIRVDQTGRDPRQPLPTVTAGNGPGRGAGAGHAMGIATPILTPAGGCEFAQARPDAPYHAVLPREDTGIAVPILAPQNTGVFGQRPDAPGPTITGKGHQSLITPLLATTGYGERDGQAARVHAVNELLGTCVDGVKQGLVSPVLMHNTTHHTGGRVDAPAPTVTTGGQTGLVAPIITQFRHGGGQSARADSPLHAVSAGGNHAMLVAALLTEYYSGGSGKTGQSIKNPLGAVTTLDRHGLVCCLIDGVEFVIVDILFRMLRPRELAKAMGFRDSYIWPATQRDTVRLIGNAVSVRTARALVGSVLPGGRCEREAVSTSRSTSGRRKRACQQRSASKWTVSGTTWARKIRRTRIAGGKASGSTRWRRCGRGPCGLCE